MSTTVEFTLKPRFVFEIQTSHRVLIGVKAYKRVATWHIRAKKQHAVAIAQRLHVNTFNSELSSMKRIVAGKPLRLTTMERDAGPMAQSLNQAILVDASTLVDVSTDELKGKS